MRLLFSGRERLLCTARVKFIRLGCLSAALLSLAAGAAQGQRIIAHRGASYDAPENTLAAFRLAWQQGADGIEGDFYLSKDRKIVCIHDEDTERTADVPLVVADSTFADLSKLDVGRWKGEAFAGERIPTLEDVLSTVPDSGRILIEIKCGSEIVSVLRDILADTKLRHDQLAIIAFDSNVIAAAKKQIPHVKSHWLTGYKQEEGDTTWHPTIDEVLTTVKNIGADGLDTNAHEVIDADFVSRLRSAGLEFHCWTVNDPVIAARFQALGVDSITTDRPAYLRQNLPILDLHKNLKLHLKLDGELKDDSEDHRHVAWATPNSARPHFQRAVFGQGLDLSDQNAPVAVRYRLPSTGTVCLWYYARDWYDYQTIFDNAAAPDAWEMWIYKSGEARFRINPRGAVVSHRFHTTGDVNEWHHMAVSWDHLDQTPDAIRLYVNGHLSATTGWTTTNWVKAADMFYLGGGNPGNSKGNGVWDDVAVFDKVLRHVDIRQIMNGGVDSIKPMVLSTSSGDRSRQRRDR